MYLLWKLKTQCNYIGIYINCIFVVLLLYTLIKYYTTNSNNISIYNLYISTLLVYNFIIFYYFGPLQPFYYFFYFIIFFATTSTLHNLNLATFYFFLLLLILFFFFCFPALALHLSWLSLLLPFFRCSSFFSSSLSDQRGVY